MNAAKKQWGFLRETKAEAEKANQEKSFNTLKTGLEEYLTVIFPEVDDWVHDSPIGMLNGKKRRLCPDYRSEQLKLIIEFDGMPHYTSISRIWSDLCNTQEYEQAGYKVVRIPYFIQLTQDVVKTLFGRDAGILFDESLPSMSIEYKNTPAFIIGAGIKRMAKEFLKFPQQYAVNVNALKDEVQSYENGVELLEREYQALMQSESQKDPND